MFVNLAIKVQKMVHSQFVVEFVNYKYTKVSLTRTKILSLCLLSLKETN
jgi:hypothetical protein